jgi:1,4-alpha-glucan branching enzyme
MARLSDPNNPATFAASKLQWEERERGPHRERLNLVRELLALRGRYLVPQLATAVHGGSFQIQGGLLQAQWDFGSDHRWRILANFDATPVAASLPPGEIVLMRGIEPHDPVARVASGGICVMLEHGPGAPQPRRKPRSRS